MHRDATMSPCGRYRYDLTRRWAEGDFALWVMLNPSTADAAIDDPTIRRCIDFTRRAGLDAAVVVNLYALRSPNPADLLSHPSPIGPRNDETIRALAARAALAIAAWGAHRAATPRVVPVMNLIRRSMLCLGETRSGAPAHPLYRPAGGPLVTWALSAHAGATP